MILLLHPSKELGFQAWTTRPIFHVTPLQNTNKAESIGGATYMFVIPYLLRSNERKTNLCGFSVNTGTLDLAMYIAHVSHHLFFFLKINKKTIIVDSW